MNAKLSNLGWDEKNLWVRGLSRGIAVYHSEMPAMYRAFVEVAFRRGYIRHVLAGTGVSLLRFRIVVSTEALATGVNMPCRAVVYVGAPVWLTPLQFHQSSG